MVHLGFFVGLNPRNERFACALGMALAPLALTLLSSSSFSQPISYYPRIAMDPPMHDRDVPASSILLILFTLSVVVTQAPFFRAWRLISDDGGGRATTRTNDSTTTYGCDYSDGKWVRSGAADAMTYGEDCPFLDPGFRCMRNGRNDSSFRYWRWQPRRGSCRLPKVNATDMLERSRNGRIVFVGDSIGRNQWESMLCMLAAAVPPGSKIYEQFGKPLSRHKGYLSMVFADYNLSVEYYRAPLLVMVDRLPSASNGAVRRAIRLDMLPRLAAHWAGADVLILNTGHWWNQHKTIKSLTTTGGNGAPPQSRSQVATHLLKELKEGIKVSGGGLLEAGNRHPDRQSASCGESATFLAYNNINPGRVSSIIWPCSHEQSSACYRN